MKVVTCLKHVVDPETFRPEQGDESRYRWIANPLDLLALEQALRVRDAHGGEVRVLTVGPPQADASLKRAIMMGADRVVRMWDDRLSGADSCAAALVLAGAIRRTGFDLLLCGARSADTGSELVGALLAEALDLPLVTRVIHLDVDRERRRVVVHRKVDRGARETYAAPLPAVLTIEEGAAEPRYCGPGWVRRLLREEVETLGLEDAGVEPALVLPRVRPLDITPPRPRTKLGTRVAGLSLREKLMVMRGEAGGKKAGGIVNGPPEEAARKMKEHLDRWLA